MQPSSLLVSFSLENYRSFRDSAEVSFVRSKKHERSDWPTPEVAPVLAILGPNASGKSNLLRGLTTMFEMIRDGATQNARASLPYSPYLLDHGALAEPTRFSCVVILDSIRYDYRFSFNAEAIISETLHAYPKGRPRLLFERDGSTGEDRWSFGDSMTGPSLAMARATRRQALLLSTAQLITHDVLTPLQDRFARLVHHIDSENAHSTLQQTLQWLTDDSEGADRAGYLLSRADLGISSIRVEKNDIPSESLEHIRRVFEAVYPDLPIEEREAQISRTALEPRLIRRGPDGESVVIPFAWESVGTRNFLAILGPVLRQLRDGGLLVVDELDTSLHARLVSEMVRLFQMSATNPRQAQLLVSTHDVTVMMNTGDYSTLERDQIWFASKDESGTSRVYPLSDFKPRRDEVFSRSYLTGKYGAVPNIDRNAFEDLWL